MKKCRILIVEDEYIVQQAIKFIIEQNTNKYEIVNLLSNGLEAIEFLKKNCVDIVITDIVMPLMDGIEFTKHVQLNYPTIQVIILSSYGDFDYVKNSFQYGAFEYLLKPKLNKDNLCSILDRASANLGIDAPNINHEDQNILKDVFRNLNNTEKIILTDRYLNVNIFLLAFNIKKTKNFNIEKESLYLEVLKKIIIKHFNNFVLKSYFNSEGILIFAVVLQDQIIGEDELDLISKKLSKEINLDKFCYDYITKSNDLIPAIINIKEAAKMHFFVDQNKKHFRSKKVEYQKINLYSEFQKKINFLEESSKFLHDFLDNCINKYCFDELELKRQVEHIVYQTFNFYFKNQLSEQNSHFSPIKLLYAINRTNCLNEMIELLDLIFMDISNYFKNLKIDSNMLLQSIIIYIDKNYNKHLTLEHLSKEFHISYSYLSTYFTQNIGLGFSEYLNKIRVDKAKMLLTSTDYSINEICDKLGYLDQSYFGKVFKKYTSHSPSVYRRLNYEKK